MRRRKGFIEEVINTHQQLERWQETSLTKRPVAVVSHEYRTYQVYSPWEKTDPTAPWYCYGKKTFYGPNAREEAKAWADEHYGPFDWVGNRMRDYVPKELNIAFPLRK